MDGRRGKIFNSVEDAFRAFDNGEVGAFLSSDFSVVSHLNKNGFQIMPKKFQKIKTAFLYHYLGGEFAPFMKRFSKYILLNSSFSEMEVLLGDDFVN